MYFCTLSIANNVLSLRPYYHPMQSVIPAEEKEVTYTEFLPCEALRPFIYCYWELKSPPRNTPFCYRVVADGCIDLFFDCNAPQMSSVMGYCNTYIESPITGAFHYVGVRFMPSAFPLLFGQDAFEISAQEIPLREVSYFGYFYHSAVRNSPFVSYHSTTLGQLFSPPPITTPFADGQPLFLGTFADIAKQRQYTHQ